MRAEVRKRAAAAAGGVLALGWLAACGPLGPLPGGKLDGELVEAPVGDWSFIDSEHTVQLETRPDDPYSVNVWIGRAAGGLYVPTSLIAGVDEPSERQWVKNVLDDPRVRLRVGGKLYPLRALRVGDAAEIEAARTALVAKYEVEADDDARVQRGWIFRLDAH